MQWKQLTYEDVQPLFWTRWQQWAVGTMDRRSGMMAGIPYLDFTLNAEAGFAELWRELKLKAL